MIKLTENFTLNEMVYSVTAQANKIDNRPSVQVIENLRQLCINVLQPLRDYLGCPVKITSGFRCATLNKKIGGVANSGHLMGFCADFIVPNRNLHDVFLYIKNNLPYQQVLFEYNKTDKWIHVDYRGNKNTKHQAIDNYKA